MMKLIPPGDDYSDELKNLISLCMSFRPDRRPNAIHVLKAAQKRIEETPDYKHALDNFHLLEEVETGNFEETLSLLK